MDTLSFSPLTVIIPTIDVALLKQRWENQEVVLIDVRQPAEYSAQHIQGAYWIPLPDLSVHSLPDTNKPLVFYCRSGKRSADAVALMMAARPALEAFSLQGGIMAWMEKGYPVL